MNTKVCKKCMMEHKYAIAEINKELFCKNCPSNNSFGECLVYDTQINKLTFVDEKCKFILEHTVTIDEKQIEEFIDEIIERDSAFAYKFCIAKNSYVLDVPQECYFKEEQ